MKERIDIKKIKNIINAYKYFYDWGSTHDCKNLSEALKVIPTSRNATLKKYVRMFGLAKMEKEYFKITAYQYGLCCEHTNFCSKLSNDCEHVKWYYCCEYSWIYNHARLTRETELEVFKYKYVWDEEAIKHFEETVDKFRELI